MLNRTFRTVLTIATAVALVVPAAATATAAAPADSGERVVAKRWGEITRIDGGLRYRASGHDNRLVMSRDGARIRFHDRAMRRWVSLPRGCRRVAVERGIAATCRIPVATTPADPLLLEIVPRLGDDRIDGSALGAEFRLSVLADDGNDVVLGGAGDDFVNGAMGLDRVRGGLGDDWIRTGDGHDVVDGEGGADRLVGTAGDDHLSGGIGEDQLEGGTGNDTLLGGPGSDILLCGAGTDTTDDDGDLDQPVNCEQVQP